MTVRAYPAYRDSKSPLLGLVPEHWSARQIKHIARLAYGESLPADGRNEDGLFKVFGSNGAIGTHGIANTSKPVIIVGRKGSYGALNWSDDPVFAIDTAYYIDNTCSNYNMRWLFWALQAANLSAFSQDTGVPGLARELVHSLAFVSPSEAEQSAIAAFLDRETGKIDALVAEQERLIALLKEKRQAVISHAVTKGLNPNAPMKDSGVAWLGEVPAHWELKRLGSILSETTESGDASLPVLSISIHDGVSDRETSDEVSDRKVARSEDRTKYKRVLPGDLAYNMMRAWQGGFGTVTVAGMVSPAYVVARPKLEIRTQFIEMVLRTPQAIEEMRRYSKGVTDFRLRLYWEEFKQILIAIPPLCDQDFIILEENKISEKFRNLSAEFTRAITLLRERRAALISAAVTGKIDVRDTVPAIQAAA